MNTETPALKHLFISPSHNFIGHNGVEPGEVEMTDHAEIEVQAGSGIVGDRYFDHKPNYIGQITFFTWETYLRICETFDRKDLEPSVFRRNIITTGLDLNELIKVEFQIQGVHFLGTEEARPCHWMNRVIGEGAKDALKGFGGLRAKILTNGRLKVGPCDLQILAATV